MKQRDRCLSGATSYYINSVPMCLFLILLLAGCGSISSAQLARPTATPTPAPLLYLLDQNGNLTSLRADGTQQWQQNLAASSWIGMGQFQIVGQAIYAASQSITALTTSGRQLWTQPLPDQTTALAVRNGVIYVVAGRLLALNTRDGSLRWQDDLPVTGEDPINQLLLTPSSLLVAGGTIIAAYSLEGKSLWSTDIGATPFGETGDQIKALYLVDNVVIVQVGDMIAAVNIQTGKTTWQRESQVQAMALIQGVLYTIFIDVPDSLTSENAPIVTGLRALQASTGQQLWQVTTSINEGNTELITSNGLYLANATSLTAWNLSGKQLWSIPMITQITRLIAQDNQLFAMAGQGSEIMSIDAQTGKQLWKQNEAEESDEELQVADHFLWQWEDGGGTEVIGRNLQDGSVRWRITTGAIAQIIIV
jgi:outer membrane protein assembly factor BamB